MNDRLFTLDSGYDTGKLSVWRLDYDKLNERVLLNNNTTKPEMTEPKKEEEEEEDDFSDVEKPRHEKKSLENN